MLPVFALLLAHRTAADLVLIHGRIWTDGHLTASTEMAVREGRIVFVGKDAAPYIGPHTTVLDAKAKWVVPGLIDSHAHMAECGPEFHYQLDLGPAKSKDEFVQRVAAQCKRLRPGAWAQGFGWSVESYPSPEPPSKAWLDPVTGDHPALYSRMDGHSVVVNSIALQRAGITATGPTDPAGGRIERDPATHEPTGVLTDTAIGLVSPPPPSAEDIADGLRAVIDEAHRYGVVAASEIVGPAEVQAWEEYAGQPGRSFRAALYLRAYGPDSAAQVKQIPEVPGWVIPRGVKLFMDGSLGSRSAYMAEPFTNPLPDQPANWRGLERPGAANGSYRRIIDAAAAANIQVATHAIGDQANHDILDLYAATPGIQRRRFRVEHAQHLLPGDIARFGELGVIASMQPYHKADDARYCEQVIGYQRSLTSYAYADLRKTGARLAFGSDFDVVTINPWVGMATAVTGRTKTGRVWMPQQDIPLDAALDAYTRGAAYAMFMEDELGRLAEGYHADFVVLDRNPKRDGSDLALVHPTAVYVEGRPVKLPLPVPASR